MPLTCVDFEMLHQFASSHPSSCSWIGGKEIKLIKIQRKTNWKKIKNATWWNLALWIKKNKNKNNMVGGKKQKKKESLCQYVFQFT